MFMTHVCDRLTSLLLRTSSSVRPVHLDKMSLTWTHGQPKLEAEHKSYRIKIGNGAWEMMDNLDKLTENLSNPQICLK